jgi:hypothetical protein
MSAPHSPSSMCIVNQVNFTEKFQFNPNVYQDVIGMQFTLISGAWGGGNKIVWLTCPEARDIRMNLMSRVGTTIQPVVWVAPSQSGGVPYTNDNSFPRPYIYYFSAPKDINEITLTFQGDSLVTGPIENVWCITFFHKEC